MQHTAKTFLPSKKGDGVIYFFLPYIREEVDHADFVFEADDLDEDPTSAIDAGLGYCPLIHVNVLAKFVHDNLL
jgi:hypothetical protein